MCVTMSYYLNYDESLKLKDYMEFANGASDEPVFKICLFIRIVQRKKNFHYQMIKSDSVGN